MIKKASHLFQSVSKIYIFVQILGENLKKVNAFNLIHDPHFRPKFKMQTITKIIAFTFNKSYILVVHLRSEGRI